MRKFSSFSLLVFTVCIAKSVYGQGQFVFDNHVPPLIDARIQFDANPNSALQGSAYDVQLWGALVGTSVEQFTLLAKTDFQAGPAAGYVNPITVNVPGTVNGNFASVGIRVVDGTSNGGFGVAFFGPFTVLLSESPAALNYLPAINYPLIAAPEPSTLVLTLAGAAGLFFIGRKTVSANEPTAHRR